jgi:hypothetical protein
LRFRKEKIPEFFTDNSPRFNAGRQRNASHMRHKCGGVLVMTNRKDHITSVRQNHHSAPHRRAGDHALMQRIDIDLSTCLDIRGKDGIGMRVVLIEDSCIPDD